MPTVHYVGFPPCLLQIRSGEKESNYARKITEELCEHNLSLLRCLNLKIKSEVKSD